MDRASLTRWLPARVKQAIRPFIVPVAYKLELGRLRELYSSLCMAHDLVFDIGAAEGYHTQVFRSLGARVVSLEPQRRFSKVLVRRFGSDPDVTVDPRGVGATAGELELAVSRGDPELSTFAVDTMSAGRYRGHTWEDRVSVEMTTLDELMATHGTPAFVKIDVEGFELPVLRGLSQMPRRLSFEFSTDRLDDASSCIDRLAQLGVEDFNYSLGRRHRLAVDEWLDADQLRERLRSIAGRSPSGGDIFARRS